MTDAIETLRARANARPGDPVCRARLALALPVGPERDAVVARTIALCDLSLELGAISAVEEAVALMRSDEPSPWDILAARALIHRGKVDEAEVELSTIVERYPRNVDARTWLAVLSLGAADPQRARLVIEPVAAESPDAACCYLQALLAVDQATEALEFGKAQLQVTPDDARLHQLLGTAYISTGDAGAAIAAYSESLRLDPAQRAGHYNLATAFAIAGSMPAALGVVDAGLEQHPDDAQLVALAQKIRAQLEPSA